MEINGNFVVIGGKDYNSGQSDGFSDIYKLSCYRNNCKWNKMDEKLQVGRSWFVAMPAPDNICID